MEMLLKISKRRLITFLLVVLIASEYAALTLHMSIPEKTRRMKAIISGAGPAGLLAAHALLSRSQAAIYEVQIFESRGDPRNEEPGPRTYNLGLNKRGQTAIARFDRDGRSKGLWRALEKVGIYSDSFILHVGKLKLQIRKSSNSSPSSTLNQSETNHSLPPPTLLISRKNLCGTMLTELERNYGDRIKVTFNCHLHEVDLNNRIVCTKSTNKYQNNSDELEKEEHAYDLLIGTDGVQSQVRRSLSLLANTNATGFVSEERIVPGSFYKVMETPFPSRLEADTVHLMTNGSKTVPYSIFLIPSPGGMASVLLSWTQDKIPDILTKEVASQFPQKVKDSIASSFTLFGEPSDEAVKQLSMQLPSVAKTVRANTYHNVKGRALLLGDAAHSTGGTLGQGANSALIDVAALDQCLDDTHDDLEKALPLFSHRQVKEGLALWKILQLSNLPPLMNLLFNMVNAVRKVGLTFITILRLDRRFPYLFRAPRDLLSLTTLPFTEIVKRNSFFIQAAIKGSTIIEPLPEVVN